MSVSSPRLPTPTSRDRQTAACERESPPTGNGSCHLKDPKIFHGNVSMHADHAKYLRSELEKNLDAVQQHVPRIHSTLENEKMYFEGVTHSHTLSIQLAREKRRNDSLQDEIGALKRDLRAQTEKRHASKSKFTREVNLLQHESANLNGKVLELELSVQKLTKEKREAQTDFKKCKKHFERQIEAYKMKTVQIINNAEDHLANCNDEWNKRMNAEKKIWIQKVRGNASAKRCSYTNACTWNAGGLMTFSSPPPTTTTCMNMNNPQTG